MVRFVSGIVENNEETQGLVKEFEELLTQSFEEVRSEEGKVVKGTVIAIEKGMATVDVGLKTEGRIPVSEFGSDPSGSVQIGDIVDVYLERIENIFNEAVLSREKARREDSWEVLENNFSDNKKVEGKISGQVKGGYTVDIDGVMAFLPRSQVDIRPIRDIGPLLEIDQPFYILKLDRRGGNIVISRRAVLEESRNEAKSERLAKLEKDQVIEGVVKNTTDYGAFIELGGVDGLLHVTDIAWKRIAHPSEVLSVGQTIKVKVIKINPETNRVSLGMKQLDEDPWVSAASKYEVGARYSGFVTNIVDYGAFVELEPGIEGLVHVSEMSWVKNNVHPNKIVSESQEVEVEILALDIDRRRISLGMKQLSANPWETFLGEHPVGSRIEGEVRNIADFGVFVALGNGIDGMVHVSDLDWENQGDEVLKSFEPGKNVEAVVLDVDINKERVSLGIKQLSEDPFAHPDIKKGQVVTSEVVAVKKSGIEVKLVGHDISSFVKRSELSRDKLEQRPQRFAVGDKIDARITGIEASNRKLSLSVRALEVAEENTAIAQYGSSDSGASLGDILGVALKEHSEVVKAQKETLDSKKEQEDSKKEQEDDLVDEKKYEITSESDDIENDKSVVNETENKD